MKSLRSFTAIEARRAFCAMVLFALSSWSSGGAAWAQSYPTRPITWVVPFTPGGITDSTSRVVTKKMGDLLGQPFVVENRPGAGGSVGTEYVSRASADGYTVLYVTSGTVAANLALYRNLKYDPLKDFIPVHGMFLSPLVLVVEASKPWKSVADLVKDAKADPGKLNFGSAGAGTGTHLTSELFQEVAGVKFVHVPYKGTTPALQDLMGGRVDLMFDYVSVMLPYIKAGKLRALAIMSNRRLDALPDVPTIAEAGFANAELSAWSGIAVPAGTPAAVVQKLSAAMETTLADKELMNQFTSAGSEPMTGLKDAAFVKFIADEQKKWGDLVRRSGATIN